jgi:hypothetical protein
MGDGGGVFAQARGIHAERIFQRQKPDCGLHFSRCQVNYAKLLEINIFFLCHNILGVVKLQDLPNK